MKRLIILAVAVTSVVSAFSQNLTPPESHYLDVELSKKIFNKLNQYRSTFNEKPYIWSDFWHNSAVKWSEYLVQNNMWGHCNFDDFNGQEMIGVVEVGAGTINYDSVALIALQQWYDSPFHQFKLVCPLMITPGDHSIGLRNGTTLDMYVSKYIGISAYVYDFGKKYSNRKYVYIVWQSGYFTNKDVSVTECSTIPRPPLSNSVKIPKSPIENLNSK